MKRSYFPLQGRVLFALLVCLAITGCYEKDCYNKLRAATSLSNNVVMERNAGRISDAKWNQNQQMMQDFYSTIQLGTTDLAMYNADHSAASKAALDADLVKVAAFESSARALLENPQ